MFYEFHIIDLKIAIISWSKYDGNYYYYYYYYYYLLQLSFHSVTVVLTLATNKNKYTLTKQHKTQ